MNKKKIMVATTGRADYGMLLPLIRKIQDSKSLDLQIIATGTHLSEHHGMTINIIKDDGLIDCTHQVTMHRKDDSEHSTNMAIADGLTAVSKILLENEVDLLVVLGDRYELFSLCIAATMHKILIAHVHGGESTLGLIDDPVRHSVTKMSTFHFPSIKDYANRIIQMGEHPDRVFEVGALGIDNIMNMDLLSREELSNITKINFNQKVALMTYHPVTLDSYESAKIQIREVLKALDNTDLIVLITMPNADTSNSSIFKEIEKYAKKSPKKYILIKNLGQKGYLSAMKYSLMMVGNSSSGIIEAASFKLPVINIGDRQGGRYKSKNIIDCECSKESILKSIMKASSSIFKESIDDLSSPYGQGRAAELIVKKIESIDFEKKSQFLKKGFYDIKH